MSATPSLRPMLSFPGWVIDPIDIDWEGSCAMAYLRRDGRGQQLKCSQYHNPMGKMMEAERTVLDLPSGFLSMQLHFTIYQGRCSHCKHFETVTPPGLAPKAQATARLKQYVSHLCRYMPCNKVPEFILISYHTTQRWDKEVPLKTLPASGLANIQALLIDDLLIDEKSIGKGHLPEADVMYDKFHIIANYNEVIDKIFHREWRQAEADDKSFIKGQRFNLFRNPENLIPRRESSLKAQLTMNEYLFQAYTLKDMLKQLWTYTRHF